MIHRDSLGILRGEETCEQKDNATSGYREKALQKAPLITVIVPSYNKPEYLPECLRSIQAQTFQDWECIVVSDGSPRVEEIAAAIALIHDARFRMLQADTNRGPAVARNSGVLESQGEFLFFVDEDDKITEDCLEKLLACAQLNGADIVHPQAACLQDGRKRFEYWVPSKKEVLASVPLLGAGIMVRRSTWEALGGQDEAPELRWGREDTEWWIRAIWAEAKIAMLPKPLYLYRRPESTDAKRASLNQAGMRRELELRRYIVRKHADKYTLYPDMKRAALSKGYWYEGITRVESGEWWDGVCRLIMAGIYRPSVKNVRNILGVIWREMKEGVRSR